jgi:hypothetical protein
MEEVRRVMRPKVMCHIRQQAWCLIACRNVIAGIT